MNDDRGVAVVFYLALWFGGIFIVPADWQQLYVGAPLLLLFGLAALIPALGWVAKALRL